MAEDVVLLSFETGEALTSIKALEAELKKVTAIYKGAKVDSDLFNKSQAAAKTVTAEIKKQTDALKANTNALGGINASAKFAEGSYGKLKQQIKENRSELDKFKIGSDEYNKVEAELIDLQKQRIAVETKMPSLFQERIKLAVEDIKTTKELKQAIKESMNDVVAGVEGANERLAELKDKLGDIKDETKSLSGTGIERLNSSMGLLTESITNFDADKMKTGLKGIGGAMKAIPIFLILEGLKLLIENFDKVFAFAQSFTAVAKEAKKLELAHEKLVVSTEKQLSALGLLEAKQEAQITIMEAQGKGIKEIEAAQIQLNATKIKGLRLQIEEMKSAAFTNGAKAKEVILNDDLNESALRVEKTMALRLGNQKAAEAFEVLIQASKRERNAENIKAMNDSIKQATEIAGQIIAIESSQTATTITNNKKVRDLKIDAARQIRQAEIDLVKDEFERTRQQTEFDAANRKKDLELQEDFYGKKKTLKELFDKKEQLDLEKNRREEIKSLQDFQNEITQFQIDLIKNDYEKQKAQIALNEKAALEQAIVTYADNAEKFNEVKKAITAKYAEENRQLALDYVTKDMEAEAEYNVIKAKTYEEQFIARQEQLKLQKQTELNDINLTENERLLIIQEYNKKEIELEREKVEQKRQIRDAEIQITADAFTALNNLAILFTDDQEKIAKLSKIGALINIGANTATAISGLVATAFAPDSTNLATGGLAAYAKLAAGITAITANMIQAKAIVNSFEDGGYTGDGATNEVSTNLGSKPYTYHKSEYVIPARVLATPTGSMLASQAESMRLGMSNPMPYIGGMYDGGFTARSAGASAMGQMDNQRMIEQIVMNMPTPVVRVTDINKVQSDTNRAMQVSSL